MTKEEGIVFGVAAFTPHDLRRTMATQLAQMGVGDEVIDAILNHTKQGVIKVYNTYKYDDQKKEALEKWSKKLTSFLSETTGQVLQLRTPVEPVSYDHFTTSLSAANEH
jgi:RNA-binding protein YhbY